MRITILILLFFVKSTAIGQHTISIIDSDSMLPIPYAVVKINNQTNLISNEIGLIYLPDFRTKIKAEIFHLGYQDTILYLEKGDDTLWLAPKINFLDEFTVRASTFKTAKEIINEAIMSISDNYHNELKFKCFYSEYTESYEEMNSKKYNIGVNFIQSHYTTQHYGYSSKKPKNTKLTEKKIMIDSLDSPYNEVAAAMYKKKSIDDIWKYDLNNYKKLHFLKKTNDYNYELIDDSLNNDFYNIAFDQKSVVKKRRFQGTIIISKKDLAFIQIEYENSDKQEAKLFHSGNGGYISALDNFGVIKFQKDKVLKKYNVIYLQAGYSFKALFRKGRPLIHLKNIDTLVIESILEESQQKESNNPILFNYYPDK